MKLSEIAYPVFKIGNKEPVIAQGVTLMITDKVTPEGEGLSTIKVIDDKNIAGHSLAQRRINLAIEEVRLYKLSKAIFFLGDLIKIAKPNTWFIDSDGKSFKYIKNIRTKLSFHKITDVVNMISGGALIEVEGFDNRFKSLFAPTIDQTYAGILQDGKSYILYGFYQKKFDETWRKI